jgi:hypothetical protein
MASMSRPSSRSSAALRARRASVDLPGRDGPAQWHERPRRFLQDLLDRRSEERGRHLGRVKRRGGKEEFLLQQISLCGAPRISGSKESATTRFIRPPSASSNSRYEMPRPQRASFSRDRSFSHESRGKSRAKAARGGRWAWRIASSSGRQSMYGSVDECQSSHVRRFGESPTTNRPLGRTENFPRGAKRVESFVERLVLQPGAAKDDAHFFGVVRSHFMSQRLGLHHVEACVG